MNLLDNAMGNKFPTVSVITVVYNGVDELQSTIDSIISQNYPALEYVIVDGGSKDGTVDLIKKNAKYVDAWITERDRGIYDAMNKGVGLATGDFVIFMNAGDRFYSPTAISQCMVGINNEDVVYGDHWVLGSRRSDGYHRAKSVEKLKYGMICSHQSMFFRRALLMSYPFSLAYGTAGDYECICRLYTHGARFRFIPNVIVSYYKAGGVSDIKRYRSMINSRSAALNNYPSSLMLNLFYLTKIAMAILVDTYVCCFVKK